MNRKIGVILSYVLMVFEVLSTLLLTPFIIRTLGQAEYGVYKLAFAINAYLLLLDLGIGNAIVRYIAKYKSEGNVKKERQFFSSSNSILFDNSFNCNNSRYCFGFYISICIFKRFKSRRNTSWPNIAWNYYGEFCNNSWHSSLQ